jgi:hypothetical protein
MRNVVDHGIDVAHRPQLRNDIGVAQGYAVAVQRVVKPRIPVRQHDQWSRGGRHTRSQGSGHGGLERGNLRLVDFGAFRDLRLDRVAQLLTKSKTQTHTVRLQDEWLSQAKTTRC